MKLDITKRRLQQLITEEHAKLRSEGLLNESALRSYELGDQVKSISTGEQGEVVTLQAHGAIIKLEDGTNVKMEETDIELASPEETELEGI